MRKAGTSRPETAAALKRYQEKRDFTQTAEPSGRLAVTPSTRLRFVIQKHAATRLHYDLRLELDGVFKSWAVTKGPSIDPTDKRLAVEVEDHPLDYGDFEGTIPRGQYGGGTVQLWDRGYWSPDGAKSPEEGLKSGDFKFTLQGKRLHGGWVLVRLKGDRFGGKRTNWLLIKHRDEFAKPEEAQALLDLDRSVASGRSMQQIERGQGKAPVSFMLATRGVEADAVWQSNRQDKSKSVLKTTGPTGNPPKVRPSPGLKLRSMPEFIEPQLCKLVERPPVAPGWGHEVKFDGYRVQLRVQGRRAQIRTRSGLDWTERFSALAKTARSLPDCIIDGEVCALGDDEMPSFAALQAALSDDRSENLVLFAFDLLVERTADLRTLALAERKQRLETLLHDAGPVESLRYVSHFESTADTVLLSARKMNLEGIVSKRLDAPYVSGRSGSWTKAKCRAGQEVVVGGWTTEAGQVRSLLAGVQRDGQLVYVGRIGTGYGAAVAAKLLPALKKLTREQSPFGGKNPPRKERNVRWLEPSLVAEIEFAGWTATGMIRQASFKGLRGDKPASQVVAEVVKKTSHEKSPASKSRTPPAPVSGVKGRTVVMGVTLSHPDKVLWPASGDSKPVSKLDLARYYEEVGDWLMPHLKGRPCSLLRAPDGVGGEEFFQRHAMAGISNLFTLVKVKGDKAPYVQIDRVEALAAVAQIGALEMHPWNCAEGNPEVAGRLVFDLDPAPDVKFGAVITAALEIRDRLERLGLESFCKTTGGKGLHVVTPLTTGKAAVAWPAAKNFAHVICAQMAHDSPTRYLDTMSKKDRVGRIFLDYLRNDRTSTAVAVLSSRARAGAPVSMPIHWKQVKPGLDPARYTLTAAVTLLRQLKPWEDYLGAAKSLAGAIRRLTSK